MFPQIAEGWDLIVTDEMRGDSNNNRNVFESIMIMPIIIL